MCRYKFHLSHYADRELSACSSVACPLVFNCLFVPCKGVIPSGLTLIESFRDTRSVSSISATEVSWPQLPLPSLTQAGTVEEAMPPLQFFNYPGIALLLLLVSGMAEGSRVLAATCC